MAGPLTVLQRLVGGDGTPWFRPPAGTAQHGSCAARPTRRMTRYEGQLAQLVKELDAEALVQLKAIAEGPRWNT